MLPQVVGRFGRGPHQHGRFSRIFAGNFMWQIYRYNIYIYIEVKCGKIKTFFFGHEVAQNVYWHPFVIIAVHLQEILSQCICLFFMSMT